MFVPKNLAEQFRRVANFYFLLVTVIAVVIDSPVSPFTSIAPLSFMVLVTAVKQGYEDWLRHKNDNKVNNQIVEIVYKGVVKEVKNSTIAPGTLVRVKRGVAVPADLVLLCSAGEQGKCFVTTANLDGETNLKTLRVPPPLVGYSPAGEQGKCFVTTANLDGETNLKTLRVPPPLVGYSPGMCLSVSHFGPGRPGASLLSRRAREVLCNYSQLGWGDQSQDFEGAAAAGWIFTCASNLVLICSAGEQGKCFVTTANLDRETNLKTLRVPPPLVGYSPAGEQGKCFVTTANLDGETNLKTLRVPPPLVGYSTANLDGETNLKTLRVPPPLVGYSPGMCVSLSLTALPNKLVLLCLAGEQGKCFITTANLDGETNLKTLRVPPPLVGYSPDILPQGMKIEVPHPEADLYTFYGRIEIPGHSSLALTTDNLMLRGSRVKNTEWAIGCAVYTGEETKLALNSKYSGNKFSSCELAINGFLVCFIFLLILEMSLSLTFKIVIERSEPDHDVYLGPGTPQPAPFSYLMQDLFSFLLLYYYIIPMSLYVTIELYKFVGALFIGWDEELCCEETGRPALANTSDLNEELGQVEVLFSDKTGTLTKNLMVFKTCSVKGEVYEERDGRLYDMERSRDPVDISQTDIKFFFTILALCHSVQISSEEMKKLSARLSANFQLKSFFKKKTKKSAPNGTTAVTIDGETLNNIMRENKCHIEYQASSPDEKALVEVAARAGATFLGEDGNTMLVKIGDQTEMYERLQVIEFTSERKRMSVIVRDKDGKIWLFCKGAESAVFPICKNAAMVETIERDIDFFANRGLRTLAVAYRLVPDEEYDGITEAIKQLDGKSAEALQQVTQQYRVLENNLTLLGATGVEDCLQDDVADTLAALKRAGIRIWVLTGDKVCIPGVNNLDCLQDDVADTLAALKRAGIRIWVLTGDKVETAINVAKSCNHMSENDRQLTILNVTDEESLQAHLAECSRIAKETSYREMTLVVDGTSMSQILDTKYVPLFVDISLKCNAVLCCRLSPIQKAEIVKIIKNSPEHPVTAAMGDGANDISMIQEAHVGIGIFGREGHQAARKHMSISGSSVEKGIRPPGNKYSLFTQPLLTGKPCACIYRSNKVPTTSPAGYSAEKGIRPPVMTLFTQPLLTGKPYACIYRSNTVLTTSPAGYSAEKGIRPPVTTLFTQPPLTGNLVLVSIALYRANDISIIQEAHVGIGIFGREGHQAARSADFAFTKFSSIKKVLLVMGHWYYQRLATLIHYFFYKNLVLGNLMLFFQTYSHFSTQSMFDSMYLTCFNLFFSSVPCFVLSVTEQRWPAPLLLQ
ncbi:cation transport ATPase (P-type) domain-containing protein [Phthorimaea operculella]|nr:cation transport ATPase (P-type) domain-containing protein [Phthorimaea operculella]